MKILPSTIFVSMPAAYRPSRRSCLTLHRERDSAAGTNRRARSSTSSAVKLPYPLTTRRVRPATSAGPHHNHGDFRRLRYRRADRAQQHARESAAAVTTHDHHLTVFRLLAQPTGRVVTHDPSMHLHVGILLLPAGQAFGEEFASLVRVPDFRARASLR